MGADIAKLEKILRLEAADNYRDQKVYRGLAAFISNWTRETIKSEPTPAEARLVEQVAEQLIEYNAMSVLQRAKALQGVLDLTAALKGGYAQPEEPGPVASSARPAARRLPPRETAALPATAASVAPKPATSPQTPATSPCLNL